MKTNVSMCVVGLLTCSAFCAFYASASDPGGTRVEVAKRDFTSLADWRSTGLSFFGVYLGEEEAEARGRLASAGLTTKTRDSSIDGYDAREEVLSLSLGSGKVEKVALFARAAVYLAGQSAKLLTEEAGEAESDVRRELLGRPDDVRVERIGTDRITYSTYGPEGLVITLDESWFSGSRSVTVVLHFVPPEKKRVRSR